MTKPTITEEDLTENEILLEIFRYVRSIAWIMYVTFAVSVLGFVLAMASIVSER